MNTRAVIFDIGGILEITPRTGWSDRWEERLGLAPGEIDARMHETWRAGSIGTITESDVHAAVATTLGLDATQVKALMNDIWAEYLGAPNTELIAYFTGLRSRCRTGILSNSFVGAREREQERYGFGDLCDVIVYSHEVGLRKPDHRIYELACERLQVRASDVVFLDDAAANVVAARELGMHGVVFTDNASAMAEIEDALESGPS